MCGFIVHWDPEQRPLAEADASGLAHRGPDGEGSWSAPGISMAHRRLAIYDPAKGGQPFRYREMVLVYNGAVYNWRELRAELERLGHFFETWCDTEVVAAAICAWGVDALARFEGVFALACYDRCEHTLLVARDTFGVRPLYACMAGMGMRFGSEAGALAQASGTPRLSTLGLAEYLAVQNHWSGHTLFEGVHEVPPGQALIFSAEMVWRRHYAIPSPRHAFGDLRPREPLGLDDDALRRELDMRLTRAVARQVDVDVPVGVYLSGGVDSGLLATFAWGQRSIRTFTVGWDEQGVPGAQDERAEARALVVQAWASHYHHETVVGSEAMETAIPALCAALDHPRVGQSHPDWTAASMAARRAKVVLSGAGADELFGGYPWRLPAYESGPDEALRWWTGRMGGLGLVRGSERPQDTVERLRARLVEGLEEDGARGFELRTFLPGLLTVADRCAMHHGVEVRVPFLDHEVVDFALRLGPEHLRPQGGLGKPMLRAVAAPYLPNGGASRPKQGFSAPDGEWFRGRSADFVRATLGPQARLWDVVHRAPALTLLEEHFAGAANRRLLVWSLLQVEFWMRRWL